MSNIYILHKEYSCVAYCLVMFGLALTTANNVKLLDLLTL